MSATGPARARKEAQKTAASGSHEAPSASAATKASNSSATASSKSKTSGSTARPTDPKKSPAKASRTEEKTSNIAKLSPQTSDDNSQTHDLASVLEKVNVDNVAENGIDKVNVTPSEEKPDYAKIRQCPICLDECTEPKQLDICSHVFCKDCIDHYFQAIKPQCPCCFTIYGEIRGNQPSGGKMLHHITKHRLPGFQDNSTGTIKIIYCFPDGIQDERHPNPGKPYYGTTRVAFLPYNPEGKHVLKLLEKAFELRQTFTVGQSRTTGHDNVVTWNDIHHKTNYKGGMENFGYPDDTYLNRVLQELAAKGIQ